MDDISNVVEKDPQVRLKIKYLLDRYIRLPHTFQPKTGYDSLIQNVTLKELRNIMGFTITDIDIELKKRISRIKY